MKYFKKNWFIFIYIFIYLLSWLGVIDKVSSKIDLVFAFLLMYYFIIQPLTDIYIENRISNLILLRALQKKRILTNEDLYLAQNQLIGDTPISDIEKLEEIFSRNGSFLEKYKTNEEILELRKKYDFLNFSIFEYFRDIRNNSSESFIDEKKIKDL